MALKPRIQALYNLLPKFEHDRDEPWQKYLPELDNVTLRKSRSEFHYLKEKEEELKSEMKAYPTGSVGYISKKRELDAKRKELIAFINELMRRVPLMKMRAERKEREVPVDMEVDEDDMFANNFLPSHLASEKPTPEPPVQPRPPRSATKRPAQSAPPKPKEPVEPARDTYLDGVKESDVDIMLKMRTHAEKYDCKDKILAALRSIRKRDVFVNIFQGIRQIKPSKKPVR